MTRKHYQTMAASLVQWRCDFKVSKSVFEGLIDELSIIYLKDNPRFDTVRFRKACGL